MKRSMFAIAALLFCAQASAMSCPPSLFDTAGKGRHALFSAVSLSRSEFARSWNADRAELSKRFPALLLEPASNLHITLVYIGKRWDPARIDDLESHGLVDPSAGSLPLRMRATPVIFGRTDNLVAFRLEPVPYSWADAVVEGRKVLTRLGLRAWDEFDSTFVPHVTLVRIRKDTPEARTQLAALRSLIQERASRSPVEFSITWKESARYFLSLPPHQVGDPMIHRELMSPCSER